MSRFARFVTVALTLLIGVGAVPSLQAQSTEQTGSLPSSLTTCGRKYGAVQVQMLIDVSISLNTSDPTNLRAARAIAWLNELARLSAQGIDVRLAISTYGTTWTQRLDWTSMERKDVRRYFEIVSSLPKNEPDTDHPLGLASANDSLNRETLGLEQPCRMLLWFTDGVYDFDGISADFRRQNDLPPTTPYSDLAVNNGNENAIKDAGYEQLCSPTGVVADLRQRNTAVLAVALGDLDFSLVDELSTGRGFNAASMPPICDLKPYKQGDLDIEDGKTTTTKASTTTTGPTASTTTSTAPEALVCGGELCSVSASFDTPGLADHVQVLITADPKEPQDGPFAPGIQGLRLTNPAGATLDLDDVASGSTGRLGNVEVLASTTTPDQVSLQLDATSPAAATGEWKVTLLSDAEVKALKVETLFFSDYQPVVESPERLRGDEANEIVVSISAPDGSAASEQLVSDLGLTVSLPGLEEPETFEMAPTGDGGFAATIPDSIWTGDEDRLSLEFTVSHPEVVVNGTQVELPVVWAGYPLVVFPDSSNGLLSLPTFDAPGSASIPFDVIGPDIGSGCAASTTDALANPDGASPTVNLDEDPVCPEPTESIGGIATVTFDERVATSFCGDITFDLSSSERSEIRTTTQTVCVSTERGPTLLTKVLAFMLAVLGFSTVFILLALNWWSSRLPFMYAARNTVVVNGRQIARPNGEPFFDDSDYNGLGATGRRRVELLDGVDLVGTAIASPRTSTGRGRPIPWMVLTGARFWVVANPGTVLAVGSGRSVLFTGIATEPVRVPASLDGLWVMAKSTTSGGGAATTRAIALKVIAGDGFTSEEMAYEFRVAMSPDVRSTFADL